MAHRYFETTPHLKRHASDHRPRLTRRWNAGTTFSFLSRSVDLAGAAASEGRREGREQPGSESRVFSRAGAALSVGPIEIAGHEKKIQM